MAKKCVSCGEYLILVKDDGAIFVQQQYDNTKGALREIAEAKNISIDPKWTTRQAGKAIIEACGSSEGILTENGQKSEGTYTVVGEYSIFRKTTGEIIIFRDYSNVKGALREIAGSIGFEYDTKWTTRQFGNKLIDALSK